MQKTERLPPPRISHTHIRKTKYRVKGTKNAFSATVGMYVCQHFFILYPVYAIRIENYTR